MALSTQLVEPPTDVSSFDANRSTARQSKVRLRTATVADAAGIWRIVKDSGVLDVNSSYAYLMFCQTFGDTTVVAEAAGEVIGFVTALCPPVPEGQGLDEATDGTPNRAEVVFVWQVGVSEAARGRGIAGRLLRFLLQQPACAGVRFLETTVTPDNAPSRALFQSLARRLGTQCTVFEGFTPDQFPEAGHEPEELHRIGPFQGSTLAHT